MSKKYSSAKKLEVVRDLLKGDKTIEQTSIKHGVSKATAKKWKKFFLENAEVIFEIKNPKKAVKKRRYSRIS